jgi:hypothetical protein
VGKETAMNHLTVGSILATLKNSHQLSQTIAPASLMYSQPQKEDCGPGAHQIGSQLPLPGALPRPKVRKRFERVMVSQVAVLDRLIESATDKKDA